MSAAITADAASTPPQSDWAYSILLLLSIVVAVSRVLMPSRGFDSFSPTGTLEALQHILVGCLIGVWIATKDEAYLWMFGVLTALEIFIFVTPNL